MCVQNGECVKSIGHFGVQQIYSNVLERLLHTSLIALLGENRCSFSVPFLVGSMSYRSTAILR
jgi:hypothetical protein